MNNIRIIQGDCLTALKTLEAESIHCAVCSPPYWGLRSYLSTDDPNKAQELGCEKTPELYVEHLVQVFKDVKRVLRKDGTLFLVIGDSYMSGGGPSRHHGYTDPKYKDGRRIEHLEPQAYSHKTLKPKDLCMIPARVAMALQADGWWLRSDIIWHKPNPMPESCTDRPTSSHEHVFLLAKSKNYYYDHVAIMEEATGYDGRKDTIMKGSKKYKDGKYLAAGNANSLSVKGQERWQYKNLQEDGQQPNTMHIKRLVGEEYLPPVRNKRDVWTVATQPNSVKHYATYPEKLIEPCIKAGCPEGGTVLDPFSGAGTTGVVASRLNRNYIGIELSEEYARISRQRIYNRNPLFCGEVG